MSDRTKIEWCDATWNPITGCTPVSAGCENCYAKNMAERFPQVHGHGGEPERDDIAPFSSIHFHYSRLSQPNKWKKPRRIFVCSMGDLFHEDVTDEQISMVWAGMILYPQHTYMVLTKRAERMDQMVTGTPPNNIWFGVTVEGPEALCRIDKLRKIKTAVRFVSLEPMLVYPGTVDLSGISWVILGGETGPKARSMPAPIPQVIRDQCISAGVPFFFKGWGTRMMKKSDPGYMKIDGREWKEFPQPTTVPVRRGR